MNWKQKYYNYKILRYFGVFLLTFSIIIWTLSIIEIIGNEIMLSNAQTYGLTIEEIWRYEGANQWWKNSYGTVILPATLILALSGITVILSPRLLLRSQNNVPRDYPFDITAKKEFSKNNNLMNKANGLKKTLMLKETTLNNNEICLKSFGEHWQQKIEEDIQTKENNIQKLRIEILDLKYERDELEKSSVPPQK